MTPACLYTQRTSPEQSHPAGVEPVKTYFVWLTCLIALVTEVCSRLRFDSLMRLSATLILPITNGLGSGAVCPVAGVAIKISPAITASFVNIMHPCPNQFL